MKVEVGGIFSDLFRVSSPSHQIVSFFQDQTAAEFIW